MDSKLTFEQVLEILSVTRQTIYNYIERGLLNPEKAFNNRVFFDKAEVNKLLELSRAVK